MRCASCTHQNPDGAHFCSACGARLAGGCPSCGRENPPGARFCNGCGSRLHAAEGVGPPEPPHRAGASDLTPAVAPQPDEPEALEGERRHLTVMFCDLVGSTLLGERLDPEDLHAVVHAYRESCAAVVREYDGHVAQLLGDGLLVYFGYPVAHEDDAERAVRAALGILEELRRVGERLEAERTVRLSVRLGIHSGPVVVDAGGRSEREPLAHGHTINLAARLQGVAEADAVVVSAATLRLVRGLFIVQDLGPQTLKGIGEPVAAYRVLRRSGVRSRLDVAAAAGLTPFVGRDREIGLLLDRWEQVQEGVGQVVVLSGEAGIGKSRLIQAFQERLGDTPHTWLESRGSSYKEDSALYPVIELLHQALRASDSDTPEDELRRLALGLEQSGFALPEALPLFASLLSLPLPEGYAPPDGTPERQRRRTLGLLLAWLLDLGRLQPMVLLAEDLHWSDPSTLELIGHLVEQVPTSPILMVLTHRPGFTPPWGARSHLTPLVLPRLTRRQGEQLVHSIAAARRPPAEVVQQIVAKADGVPLFLEELTKSVLESSALAKDRDAASPLTIPETLQDSLMARLDRLSPVKEVAQLCATLGREFSYEVLQAVSPLEEGELQEGLARLEEAELLYRRGLGAQSLYIFKDALVQETAYQSLLKARRQQFHRKIAEVLVARFPARVEAQPEAVAHHYWEAGQRLEALVHLENAGRRAVRQSACEEAARHLRRALEALEALPEGAERAARELGIRTLLGVALIARHGYGAAAVAESG